MKQRLTGIVAAALVALAAGVIVGCPREESRPRRDAAAAAEDSGAEARGREEDGAPAPADGGASDAAARPVDGGRAPAGDGGAAAEDAAPPSTPARADGGSTAPATPTKAPPPPPAPTEVAPEAPVAASDGGPARPTGDGGAAVAARDGGDESDAEARQVAALVQRRYRDARGFEADFEQTYRNRLMGRNQKSSGHVWLRPPDRMRWEYAPPSKNLIVADGTHLFVFEPEPNQVVQMPVTGSELPSVMAFLTGGRDLTEDYVVRAVHGEELASRGQAGLELRPRRPSSVISRVVLVVARAAGEVLRTVLVDPEGNTNTFVWSAVRTDRDLPDSRFSFTPPAGARVVER